jgi:hypothetical protein
MQPPALLDGAPVIYVADVSRLKPTGHVVHYVDGVLVEHFYRLAIAQYEGKQDAYVFLCDKEWNVVTDLNFASTDECLEFIRTEYPGAELELLNRARDDPA